MLSTDDRSPGRRPWWLEAFPELEDLVGKAPDAEIANQLGVSTYLVTRERLRQGLPATPGKPKRWTPDVVARLGKEPDAAIARDLGISPRAVCNKRLRLGIPCFGRSTRPATPRPTVRGDWTPENMARLGNETDSAIAGDLGITRQAVWSKRQQLGIPSCRPTTRPGAPTT
jgi:hypothetical protein